MKSPSFTLKCAALAAATASMAALSIFPIVSDDLFLYLQTGKTMVDTGSIPKNFGFTFTLPDYEMEMMGEWLSCVFFHLVHLASGWNGLIFFKTALVALFVLSALAILRLNGRVPPGAAAVIVLAAYASADRFIERSSLFSDVLFCVLLVMLLALKRSLTRRSRRVVLYLPLFFLLFLVWGNVHSGYWPALGAIFCFFAGDLVEGLIDRFLRKRDTNGGTTLVRALREEASRLWIWAACGCVSFAACFCNPFFHETVFFPFKIKQDAEELSRFYGEYMPTFTRQNFASSWQLHAFLALVAIFVFLAAVRWRRKPIKELFTAGLLVYSSTLFVRFLSFAALGLALLAIHLLAASPRAAPRKPASSRKDRLAAAGAALELCACLLFAAIVGTSGYSSLSGQRRPGLGLDLNAQPVAAADFIEKHGLQSVRFFNQHEAGGYLAWRFDGRMKVFFHGWVTDNDFYFNEYFTANRSPAEFNRIVEKYDIEAFLLTRPPLNMPPERLPPLYLSLYIDYRNGQSHFSGPGSSPWRLVWWDNRYLLYLKETPRLSPVTRSDWYKYADPAMTHFYFLGLRDERTRTLAEKERAQVSFRGLVLPPAWERE